MWNLYDYVNHRKINEIKEWTLKALQKTQRKRLRSKLDMLAKAGPELPPGLLMKTEVPYIYKLKVQGNPRLRPMLCKGPVKMIEKDTGQEKMGFTLLIGAADWG